MEDERSGNPDVVVLTDGLWKQRFNGDAAIVGRSIDLDGKPYLVVGIAPPGVRLPVSGQLTEKVDAFVPIRVADDEVGWVGDHNYAAVGRLRVGATLEQARAELDVLQAQVSRRASDEVHQAVTLSAVVTPLAGTVVGKSRRGLLLLLAAILAVLLIACSNLANLSLTRASAKTREVAIRSALGASRTRLVARAVLEQLVLAMAGGALGLWMAWAALALFVRTAPVDLPRVSEVALDGRVLAFAAALSIVSGLIVALLPAWRTAASDVQAALRAGGTVAGDRHGMKTRSLLLATQVALSVALLVVTALLVASFIRVMGIDKGFSPDRVLAVSVALPVNRYAEEPVRQATYDRLLAAVHDLSGVRNASMTSLMPMSGEGGINFIAEEGQSKALGELPTANFRFIGPEFFSTLGIRLVRGRPFNDSERAADRAAPAVISASVAARVWPRQEPIGQRFSRGNEGEQGFEVVGVAADARTTSLEGAPPLMVYVPYWWRSRATTSLLIRTAGDPAALTPSVRRAIRGIDPDIAVGEARSLDAVVERAFAGRRYQMQLFVAFGVMALVIATIGVYAVTAYGVSRRRREMNVRVALGATTGQVFTLVVRHAAMPLAAGVVIGAGAAAAAGTVVASLLFEVSARDPTIISAVAALVVLVGVAATLTAAKQGLVLNPAAALRDE